MPVRTLPPPDLSRASRIEAAKRLTRELVDAVKQGDVGAVEQLLARGADVNGSTGLWTPLGAASNNNDLAMAKLLRARGANPEGLSFQGRPAEIAFHYGHVELAAWLTSSEGGADPNAPLSHGVGCLLRTALRARQNNPPPDVKELVELRSRLVVALFENGYAFPESDGRPADLMNDVISLVGVDAAKRLVSTPEFNERIAARRGLKAQLNAALRVRALDRLVGPPDVDAFEGRAASPSSWDEVCRKLTSQRFKSVGPVKEERLRLSDSRCETVPTLRFERTLSYGLRQVVFATPFGASRPVVEGLFDLRFDHTLQPRGVPFPPRDDSDTPVRFSNVRLDDGVLRIDVENVERMTMSTFELERDALFERGPSKLWQGPSVWIRAFSIDERGLPTFGNREAQSPAPAPRRGMRPFEAKLYAGGIRALPQPTAAEAHWSRMNRGGR